MKTKRHETAPSAIKTSTRQQLVLHAPEVMGAKVPAFTLWTLAMIGAAINIQFFDGGEPDQPWWLVYLLYVMGIIGVLGVIAVIRSDRTMTFDFAREQLLRWYYPEKGKEPLTETIRFSQFEKLRVEFNKAQFSDDHNSWKIWLHTKDERTFLLLNASGEEVAYQAIRRLADTTRLPVEDPQALFPLKKPKGSVCVMSNNITPKAPGALVKIIEERNQLILIQRQRQLSCMVIFLDIFAAFWCTCTVMMAGDMIKDVGNLTEGMMATVMLVAFTGVGLFTAGLALWMHLGRTVLRVSHSSVIKEERLFGWRVWQQKLDASSILRVDMVEFVPGTSQLRVFGSHQGKDVILKFGEVLKREELAWVVKKMSELL